MAKHTPGPWRAVRGRIPERVSVIGPNSAICRMYIHPGFIEADREKVLAQARVDADFIAAAPELSEALQACANKFWEYVILHKGKRTPDGDAKAARNREMAEMCETVLAKSRGEHA